MPDEYWQGLVDGLYADFESVLMDNFNMELIPIEDVLKSKSYAKLKSIKDTVTKVEVEKSYKGTKNLIPTRLGEIVSSISTTFAADRVDARLINELGVDGIIAVTLDLTMNKTDRSLKPQMSIRISGAPNGYTYGPSIYLQGTLYGNGTSLKDAAMDAKYMMEVLPNVIRQADLKEALGFGFKEMLAKEKEKPYETLWALKGPIYSE